MHQLSSCGVGVATDQTIHERLSPRCKGNEPSRGTEAITASVPSSLKRAIDQLVTFAPPERVDSIGASPGACSRRGPQTSTASHCKFRDLFEAAFRSSERARHTVARYYKLKRQSQTEKTADRKIMLLARQFVGSGIALQEGKSRRSHVPSVPGRRDRAVASLHLLVRHRLRQGGIGLRIVAIDALCGSVVFAPTLSGTDTARPADLLVGSALIGLIRNHIESGGRLARHTRLKRYGYSGGPVV